jgi:hypothetical protein
MARFRSERTHAKDDERPRRLFAGNISAAIPDCFNKNPSSWCDEVAQDVLVRGTGLMKVLTKFWQFFLIAGLVGGVPSGDLSLTNINKCEKMLEMLGKIYSGRKTLVIPRDECCICNDNCRHERRMVEGVSVCLTFAWQVHRKMLGFRLISLAKNLIPSTNFRKTGFNSTFYPWDPFQTQDCRDKLWC